MAFQKGDPKPDSSGRKKGVKNKRTVEIDDILSRALLELSGSLEDDVSKVNSSRRLQLLTDMLNYFKPKLSSNKNENDTTISGGINVIVTYGDDDKKNVSNDV